MRSDYGSVAAEVNGRTGEIRGVKVRLIFVHMEGEILQQALSIDVAEAEGIKV